MVHDTENLHFYAEFRGVPLQVAATAAWKAADIPCGCSAPADILHTYIRKMASHHPSSRPGWYWYWDGELVYRLLLHCPLHPGELSIST